MVIGFSTGSLALGDVRLGLQMVEGHATAAIELSALREAELLPLIESLDEFDLVRFSYISLHAPSKLQFMTEAEAVSILTAVAQPTSPNCPKRSSVLIWGTRGRLIRRCAKPTPSCAGLAIG